MAKQFGFVIISTMFIFYFIACKSKSREKLIDEKIQTYSNDLKNIKENLPKVNIADGEEEHPLDAIGSYSLFRDAYGDPVLLPKDSVPFAICFTTNELRKFLDSIDRIDLPQVDTGKRGIAFIFAVSQRSGYRKNKATVVMIATKFVKNRVSDGKIDTMDNRITGLLYDDKKIAGSLYIRSLTRHPSNLNSRAYDVGHIYP